MQVVAVDWSGNATNRGQQEHIWVGVVRDHRLVVLENGRLRHEVIQLVIEAARRDGSTVVGLDFAFSFPAWFLRAHNLEDVGSVWNLVATDGEEWLRGCRSPFWGRPGTTRPMLPGHFRVTDLACKPVAGIAPKSVFQIGGAGAVGTGSIRGMPLLRDLRSAGFGIWPFDPIKPATAIEIYPRALTGPVKKSDPAARWSYLRGWGMPEALRARAEDSEDAFDAAISALRMSRNIGSLTALRPTTDPVTLLEGSIWTPPAIDSIGVLSDARG
jgi:hypothetical protein